MSEPNENTCSSAFDKALAEMFKGSLPEKTIRERIKNAKSQAQKTKPKEQEKKEEEKR